MTPGTGPGSGPLTTGAVPVDRYGTGLLRTEIFPLGGSGERYVWRRRPGPRAPAPFAEPSPETSAFLAGLGTGDGGAEVRLAVGRPEGAARSYLAPGRLSVARILLTEGPAPRLTGALRGLGRALHALHTAPVPGPPPYGRSRGLDRLGTWLASRTPEPRAAQAAVQVRRVLGEVRWERLHEWYGDVARDPRLVLAHGAAGLGSLVTTPGGPGQGALLTGEDLCLAPWYLDLGWVTGELIELRWQLGGDPGVWQSLLDALYEGYGSGLGADPGSDHGSGSDSDSGAGAAWQRLAALRILLHVHDAAAYHHTYTGDFTRYAEFLKFLTSL